MTTKTIKTLLLVLSSAFLLGGCDSVESLPQNYEENIVVNNDTTDPELYKNIMGEIWNAINSGKSDKTLEEFLKIVSKDKFGTWEEIKALAGAADDALLAYANKYSDMFVRESDSELATQFNTTADAIKIKRVKSFREDINKRINEVYYNEIKSGSYSKDNIFYEERLAFAHYADLYDIDMTYGDDAGHLWHESYITPEFTKEDVSSMLYLDVYDDYTERKILPDILKDKLVEEYLYNNNYQTLGRSYARKVNIIKLTRDDKYKSVPRAMMEQYVASRVEGQNNANAELNFEELANAWRGFSGLTRDGLIADPNDPTVAAQTLQPGSLGCNILSDIEIEIAEAAGDEMDEATIYSTGGLAQVVRYYKNTKLGILLDKYNTALAIDQSNRWLSTEETEALNEFTSNNTQTIQVGLREKLAELAVTDYTTDGWYVKNGGLSDLPEAIRSRLFNIVVANNVDNIEPEGQGVLVKKTDYVRNINGNYLLVPSKVDTDTRYNYIIFDSGSYYLVQVLEAPSTSKMNLTSDNSYTKHHPEAESVLFTENVAMEIAKVLGTKDSYINNAYASYIEAYAIEYHDTAVYDYFKGKFPELFED